MGIFGVDDTVLRKIGYQDFWMTPHSPVAGDDKNESNRLLLGGILPPPDPPLHQGDS